MFPDFNMINNSSVANFTKEVFSFEAQDITIAEKVIAVVVWIYFEFISNPLYFGIVQFERLGGDPLKRRITDQVYTNKIFSI